MSKMKSIKESTKFKLILLGIIFVLLISILVFVIALIQKNLNASKISRVIGVDVSAYQGEIDWKELEEQGIYFAYIKATEGSDYLDSRFEENWKNIDKTNIKKGAYLYYVFSEDGDDMADYFIENVPRASNSLPPVIDIEIDNSISDKLPEKKTVINNLKKLIENLEDYYRIAPIIYTNLYTYDTYLENSLGDLKFWICDVSNEYPDISDDEWLFWQFTWRGMYNGYEGSSQFIDLDLFNGNLKEFYDMFETNQYRSLTSGN